MAYLIEVSNSLSAALEKFTTLNRHQLAGQVENLSFWIQEVQHCLSVIDGYHRRFESMKSAQVRHTREHHTVEFVLHDPCCLGGPAAPPKRIPEGERKDARRTLCDAFYKFIVRCHNSRLLDKAGLEHAAASIGISIDASDLKR